MILDGITLLVISLILATIATSIWVLSAYVFKSSPKASLNYALANLSLGGFIFFYIFRQELPHMLGFYLSDMGIILGCLLLSKATQLATLENPSLKKINVQIMAVTLLALALDIFARTYDFKAFAVVVVVGFSLIGIIGAWYYSYSYMIKYFPKSYCLITTSSLIFMIIISLLRIISALLVKNVQLTDLRIDTSLNTGFLLIMIITFIGFNATAIGLVITKMIAHIRLLSQEDPLTKTFNRRHLNILAEIEITKAKKNHSWLSVIVLDIDHFKKVNDIHGHAAGDAALVDCVSVLRKNIRVTDYIGRLGGEEFCILLPNTDTASAQILAERIRTGLESHTVVWENKEIPITASFGITTFYGKSENEWSNLLNKADIAMYQAKNNGRNQVVIA